MDDLNANDRKLALWVLRAQSGDRRALDRLLENYQSPLFRYLRGLLQNDADAEDALQMTFMQAYRKLSWLRDPKLFRPWLFRIASRVAFRQLRQRHKMPWTSLDQLSQAPDAEFNELQNRQEREAVKHLVSKLLDTVTVRGREVLVLHFLDGFTLPEVAEILEIPLGTVKSRLGYALACLREQTSKTLGEE